MFHLQVALVLVGLLRTSFAVTDDFKQLLDHCQARNITNPDQVFGRAECQLNCIHHYQMNNQQVADDGVICSYDLAFACRDGFCRSSTESVLQMDNIYNHAINDFKLNAAGGYLTMCLVDIDNEDNPNATLHDVELPIVKRKHCIKCDRTGDTAAVVTDITCKGFDIWNWHAQSVLVLETWAPIEEGIEAFITGAVFRFSEVVPTGQRAKSFQFKTLTDSVHNLHHIMRMSWESV